jgi:hypothetical protein
MVPVKCYNYGSLRSHFGKRLFLSFNALRKVSSISRTGGSRHDKVTIKKGIEEPRSDYSHFGQPILTTSTFFTKRVESSGITGFS